VYVFLSLSFPSLRVFCMAHASGIVLLFGRCIARQAGVDVTLYVAGSSEFFLSVTVIREGDGDKPPWHWESGCGIGRGDVGLAGAAQVSGRFCSRLRFVPLAQMRAVSPRLLALVCLCRAWTLKLIIAGCQRVSLTCSWKHDASGVLRGTRSGSAFLCCSSAERGNPMAGEKSHVAFNPFQNPGGGHDRLLTAR